MTIELAPDVAAAVATAAAAAGRTAEELVADAVRARYAPAGPPFEPRDEWERRRLAIGRPLGASLPDSAFDRENLYD